MNPSTTTIGTTVKPHAVRRKRGRGFWIWRILLGLLVLLVALPIAGATYQAVATALDRRAYPAPGQLVDVGGYRLHIQCVGQGSPTVILESGLANISTDWANVQPDVAATTRTCAYDRAGNGWSDSGPLPRDPHQIASELHTLLGKAGIPGPYVLVGQSFGGLYVRMYAAQYPAEVAGMVLVDASHPDMWARMPAAVVARNQPAGGQRMLYRVLARLGFLRLTGRFPANCGLPARYCAEERAWTYTTKRTDSYLAEMLAPERDAQVRATGSLGEKPLVVLTATDHRESFGVALPPAEAVQLEATWQVLQGELAALSSNSIHRTVEGANHSSLQSDVQTARVTGGAIRQVVDAARTGQPLAR